jgi:murein tripeptide amidase MpaA
VARDAQAVLAGFNPGRYLRYEEMTELLQACAAAYPTLCRLEAVGQSREGRPVWAVVLTNSATGPDTEKPGYLIDANTHAGEVTGGAAVLYAIQKLLTGYGTDAGATELLDTRAFYVVPRLAVDGVEVYLTTPHMLRSSPRRYPEPEEVPGLYPEDLNGDGHILTMRVEHPDGDYRVDAEDRRLLVKRRPEDTEGPFYKLYTEGLIHGWDGLGVPREVRPWRMDFNRNYPAFWNPEGKQPGAGPYPLSEPETKALAEFVIGHPNIGAYVAFHTTGGVLLRPPSNGGDDTIDQADLEGFKRVGELCARITGHPCKSTYQAFNYPGQEALVKGADDWAYEHYGVQAYTFELWNPDLRAGNKGYAQIGVKGLLELGPDEVDEAERKLLAWNDRELDGKGFVDWQPFEHPQLGRVEIGGWVPKFAMQNPPEGPILAEEAGRAADFVIAHALTMPLLTVKASAVALGAGLYKVTATVANTGALSTSVTKQAVKMKAAKPVEVRLEGEVQVLSGKACQEVGHLEGWATAGGRSVQNEAGAEWVVSAAAGAVLTVTAGTARAGRASVEVALS